MNTNRPPRATFHQLRTLEAVARLGSITQAARELHLTQPTVSVQIQELQSAVGVALLEPAGRGIRLTEAGRLLQQTALQMTALWRTFEDDLQALQGLERGKLRIAGVTTTEYFIARWLKQFSDQHPGIDIDLSVDNRGAVVRRLERDDTDLAVMMMPPTALALESTPFLDNPLVLIGPCGHPWATRKRLPRQLLNDQRLLMREPGSGTRLATEEWLRRHAIHPDARMTLGSNEAIKHAVAAGLGLAVVSRHALAADPAQEGLAVLPLEGFPELRTWQLVWRRDRRLPLAAAAFVRHVQAH